MRLIIIIEKVTNNLINSKIYDQLIQEVKEIFKY